MPQLEIINYLSQIFWLLVTFGVLFLVVSNFITPHLGNVIEIRKTKIQNDLLQAEQLRKNAESINNGLEHDIQQAIKEASQKVNNVIMQINDESKNAIAIQEKEINIKSMEAEKKVQDFIESSEKELEQLSLQIVKILSHKFLHQNIDDTYIISQMNSVKNNSKEQ